MRRSELPKGFVPPAGETTLLPQYTFSDTMDNRFDLDIQKPGQNISRPTKAAKGPHNTDRQEEAFENLQYFSDNKAKFETEFFEQLSGQIGEAPSRRFCDIIRDYWYDGTTKRKDPEVLGLMASIRDYYLDYNLFTCRSEIPVRNRPRAHTVATFQTFEIEAILKLNQGMLTAYLPEWLSGHPRSSDKSMDHVYFRRGISTKRLPKEGPYKEFNFISSYSLAISVPEFFTQIKPHIRALIHIHHSDTTNRVLFFSPFVPGMTGTQLEFGIIPAYKPQIIICQGKHGGIYEHLVERENILPDRDQGLFDDWQDFRGEKGAGGGKLPPRG
jgi:hypothetical protein